MRFYKGIPAAPESFEILAKDVNFQIFSQQGKQIHEPQDSQILIYLKDELRQ